MIVDSMTHDEIYNALIYDKMYIQQMSNINIKKLKRQKRTRNTTLNIIHPFSKNTWKVKIEFKNNYFKFLSYCKWNTLKGWRAATIVSNSKDKIQTIQIFNSHFFIRYYQRFILPSLGKQEIKKIVELYFKRNPASYSTVCSDAKNSDKIEKYPQLESLSKDNFYLFSADGVGIGKVSNDKYQIANTFYAAADMNNNLLKAYQSFI